MQFKDAHILKIKVQCSGDLYINNKFVSFAEFEDSLLKLKKIKGAVWFFRENSFGIPNEIAEQVFKRILQMKVAVSLSSIEDFSDWIDENGQSFPRLSS